MRVVGEVIGCCAKCKAWGGVETIAEVENLVCRLLCFAWWLYFGLLE